MRNAAIVGTAAAALICLGVTIREHDWRHTHPYQLGPSGYIVALGIAGVILAAVLGYILREIADIRRWHTRHVIDDDRHLPRQHP